jgi:signal transduction histidine kinase
LELESGVIKLLTVNRGIRPFEIDRRKRIRLALVDYAMAVGCVLLALGIGSLLEPLVGYRFPLIFFAAASLAAAWLGGFGPGVLALVAGFLVGDFFFVPPLHRFGGYSATDCALLLAYCSVSAFGLAAIIHMRHAQQREEQTRQWNNQLERRVQERTAELEAFCYSISHDLRAPIRGIVSFGQLLREDYEVCFDQEGRHTLSVIIESAMKMDQLLDDLLRLSRLSRREMQSRAVNLSALARDIAHRLQKNEPQRNVEFVIAPDLMARGDEMLLRVALENLLGNAWKFTAKRPAARVEIGCAEQDDQPAYFVRDNGIGFDMAHTKKLFGVFERLHSDAAYPGTGIGLAMVQRIIHRHGGKIWAQGVPDQGATFYFTLPDQPARSLEWDPTAFADD